MKKESWFYILILVLIFFILGCGSKGRPESSYIGCYTRGTPPTSSAKPVPAGTLTAETFGGYYPGGKGNINPSCYASRQVPSCVSAYNACTSSCCSATCGSGVASGSGSFSLTLTSSCSSGSVVGLSWTSYSGATGYYGYRCSGAGCTPPYWTSLGSSTSSSDSSPGAAGTVIRYQIAPNTGPGGNPDAPPYRSPGHLSNIAEITIPKCCSSCVTCPFYEPGPSTPSGAGPSVEISGFGWVWGDITGCTSTNKYEKATIYDGDDDKRACACIKDSYWDGSADAIACCGDDLETIRNPSSDGPDDPDDEEAFCTGCKLGNNIGSRVWYTGGCCGDDNEDCAVQSSAQICSMDSNFKSPAVYSSADAKGDIRYIGCIDKEFLADGSTWLPCEGTFTQTKVKGNDYLCKEQGKESIYECCGEGSCNSDTTDGVRLKTGQSINVTVDSVTKIFYCASDKTFTTDLDIKDEITCTKAGFAWTGTKCCTEADDTDEYYNDEGEIGGCWNNESIKSVDFVRDLVVSISRTDGSDGESCTYTGRIKGINKKRVMGTYSCSGPLTFSSEPWEATSSSDISPESIGKVWGEVEGFRDLDSKWIGTWTQKGNSSFDAVWTHPTLGKVTAKLKINIENLINDSILNYNGEFHGCVLDKTVYNKVNDVFLGIQDKFTGNPLITNHEYCFVEPENNYFCSYKERWLPTEGSEGIHVSISPIPNQKQQGECCPLNKCWNGNDCIANQREKPLELPIGDGFRCIDGEWVKSILKYTPDGSQSGYCPKDPQCLFDPNAKNESTQCTGDKEYVGDYYCENGIWSTRTKLLALKLIKFKGGDYTLFCDNKANTLNYLNYQVKGKAASAVLDNDLQAGNFCVLSTASTVIVGTSINKNISQVSAAGFNIFGIKNCSRTLITDYAQYNPCDSSNKVWFNWRLNSLIYSPTPISIPKADYLESFDEIIGTPIQNVIDSVSRLITSPPVDNSYSSGIKKFDKLYISQKSGRAIKGSMQGKNLVNAVIEYDGFNNNLCEFVDQFNQLKKDEDSGVACKAEGTNYYVLAQGGQFTNINPESIWTDLTSKLRIR